MLLLYIPKIITLTKVEHVLKLCLTKVQDCIFTGICIDPASDIRTANTLRLLTVKNFDAQK